MMNEKEIKIQNINDVMQNFSGPIAVWVPDVEDNKRVEDSDLAAAVQFALENNLPAISCPADAVGRIWPWLEGTGVKIYAQFCMDVAACEYAVALSELCACIRAAFLDGADGVQVFVSPSDLPRFANEIAPVWDDLFFGKTLSIGLNILDVKPLDLENILENVKKLRASSVVFAVPEFNEKTSDFVGRIYGAINAWDDASPALHLAAGIEVVPMDMTAQLIEKIRPDMAKESLYWVSWQ